MAFCTWPANFLVLRVRIDHRILVPLDEDGVLTDELEVIVERELGGKESHALTDCSPFRALFYTIPVYHNPTGYCLSKGLRKNQ